ncbi:restriction endonuclease [Allorhodopirellula solitaria]|uniref:Restriction endonuclease type IV Mrr domain-containing protein n=1 Tax=Allorhodopirellula solitaria TaxID=2527987 RepID=A0A5C5XVD4_9BACT|nr:restriction endonuclease [Allorhodopirellula solitaria]TWT67267.1 hypothetical protein CA85_21170 [Allorhodopirellula solitaria]
MPKRTNSFQQSIRFIYEAIAEQGFVVLESEELTDSDGSTLREVDLLIRGSVAGHAVSIAIECRDRSRKDTVEWIDQLIGKYTAIPVQKVVAVSATGFSRSATDKAKKHQIETLTLAQAEEADWAGFVKLGAVVTHSPKFELLSVEPLTEDPDFPPLRQILDWTAFNDRCQYGSFREFLGRYFRERLVEECLELYNAEFGTANKTLEDLKSAKTFLVESSIEMSLVDEAGEIVTLPSLRFMVKAVTQVTTLDVNHRILNGTMLSESTFNDSRGEFTFRAAQQSESKNIVYKHEIHPGG